MEPTKSSSTGMKSAPPGRGNQTRLYDVEHLTTFGFGEDYNLFTQADGLNKLSRIQQAEPIYPQKMTLNFTSDSIVFKSSDTGELIESFPLKFVSNQFSYICEDPSEEYNNLLAFVVNPDRSKNTQSSEEMHMFQCLSTSAHEILVLLQKYIDNAKKDQSSSAFKKIKKGTRKENVEISDAESPSANRSRSSSIPVSNSNSSPKVSITADSSNNLRVELSPKVSLTNRSRSNSSNLVPELSSKTSTRTDSNSPKPEISHQISMFVGSSIDSKIDLAMPEISISEVPVFFQKPVAKKYLMEHLATFDFGKKFGVSDAQTAVRKLKSLDKTHSIWVQNVIMRLKQDLIILQDLDKKRIGRFPKHTISNICAYFSTNQRDAYNNLLFFVVNHEKYDNSTRHPQMYIFQCLSHSAMEIAKQIKEALS